MHLVAELDQNWGKSKSIEVAGDVMQEQRWAVVEVSVEVGLMEEVAQWVDEFQLLNTVQVVEAVLFVEYDVYLVEAVLVVVILLTNVQLL